MSDFQTEKARVRALNAAIDAAAPEGIAEAITPHVSEDWLWRGMHPWHEQTGAAAVAETFWQPLRKAMGSLQRRPDMFMAGRNMIDGYASTWVVEMGHLMGLWDAPFLGHGPSRRIAFFRYAEFHRVEDDRIVETASFFDILNLLVQGGYQFVQAPTGATLITPGPRTHGGLLYEAQDPEAGPKTLALINAMIDDLIGIGVESPFDHMDQYWTKDMCWFGPGGIGASAFREGYKRGHTGPFEDGLEFLGHYGHICRLGEGNFGGFFGWPSMSMRPTGGYMGLPEQSEPADMRIVDLYRREGELLAENWIFIDLPHFYAMQGIDLLAPQ